MVPMMSYRVSRDELHDSGNKLTDATIEYQTPNNHVRCRDAPGVQSEYTDEKNVYKISRLPLTRGR